MLSGHLQEKNGIYYAVLNCKHLDGRRRPKWVSTGLAVKKGNKRAADKKLNEFKATYSIYGESPEELEVSEATSTVFVDPVNIIVIDEDMLFADYMEQWLSDMEVNVDPLTYSGYSDVVTRNIVPYFREKGITLQGLTGKDLKDYYKYERLGSEAEGRKPKKGTTVTRYHANIHKALEDAVEDGLLDANVAHKKRPKSDKFVGDFYLADEATELLEVAVGTKLEIAVLFGLFYGLRRSEIVGLKWQNIDFLNNSITIAHTITQYRKNGKTLINAKDRTKNKSSLRSLPLVPYVKERLLVLREAQQEAKLVLKSYYHTEHEAYVYLDEVGLRIKPSYITESFPRLLKRHGLRKIRFHDTRHSCASLLLKSGVSLKHIQEWLGHSDIATTANIYAHLDIGSSKLQTAACMTNGLLGLAKEKPILAIEVASMGNSVAEEVGFEPTWELPPKLISNQPRYDHFDTPPY